MADIKSFYKALALYCVDADIGLKSEVVRCFRCIINAGQDPGSLKSDVTSWKSKEGNKVQIKDTTFIQSLIRECSIIEFVASEFLKSVEIFEEHSLKFEESSLLYTNNIGKAQGKKSKKQTLKETLRDYGLSLINELEQEACGEEKLTRIDENENENENSMENTVGENDEIVIENNIENDIENTETIEIKSFSELKLLKLNITSMESLTQDLFDLCTELSEDPLSAEIMSAFKVCDGLIKYLNIIVKHNFRDKRAAAIISLIWTLLEAYLNKMNIDLEKSKILNENIENSDEENENIQDSPDLFDILNQESAVQVLRDFFILFAQDGFKNPDKECRNEVLAVLTVISESPSSHSYFIQTGLLNDILYFACYAECSSSSTSPGEYSQEGSSGMFSEWLESHPQSSSNPRNFCTACELDLQFKRGLWILISELLKNSDSNALDCVGQSPLLQSLLLYLEFDTLQNNVVPQTPSVAVTPHTTTMARSQALQLQHQLQLQQLEYTPNTNTNTNAQRDRTNSTQNGNNQNGNNSNNGFNGHLGNYSPSGGVGENENGGENNNYNRNNGNNDENDNDQFGGDNENENENENMNENEVGYPDSPLASIPSSDG